MKLIRAFILFMALAQSGWVFAAGQPFTKSQFDNLMKEGTLPIVILGLLSREAMLKAKVKLQGASGIGKKIFGMLLIVVSLTILIGQDKKAEEILNQYSPDWLTALTTTY